MEEKKGILIIDLGMSNHPNLHYIQKNLSSYLSNRKSLQLEQIVWQAEMGLILEFKTKKKIKACRMQNLFEKKGEQLPDSGASVEVEVEMVTNGDYRSMEKALARMGKNNVRDLTVIPMFSQYTEGAVEKALNVVTQYFIETNYTPQLKFIRSFANHPEYIGYFSSQIARERYANHIDALVFSYPIVPDYEKNKEDYYRQCESLTESILENIPDIPFYQTYQSPLSRKEQHPAETVHVLSTLPKQGKKNVLVVSPRLVIDCFNVAKKIEKKNQHLFYQNGGTYLKTIFPLMEAEEMTEFFAKLVE